MEFFYKQNADLIEDNASLRVHFRSFIENSPCPINAYRNFCIALRGREIEKNDIVGFFVISKFSYVLFPNDHPYLFGIFYLYCYFLVILHLLPVVRVMFMISLLCAFFFVYLVTSLSSVGSLSMRSRSSQWLLWSPRIQRLGSIRIGQFGQGIMLLSHFSYVLLKLIASCPSACAVAG